ncbi:HAD family hydrolase [Anaerotignum sp. MB30-C6]|uniref:HAD family hydrolase n=1 Tax=Anaerotignum sp. MB30-C6 TaxID=3070814 RepID=UPI0027DD7715|nr:HAD family hydrolase [Anaerotignum sp. MB30-C6]WMI81495.1 HAD family hydrolase [Anaerotignum sp. MB30-C6]
MIKLIVSDMDGTLLNDKKSIDPEIYKLLPRLHENGIRFVVASGRQYPSLKKHFDEHMEDVVVIAENGAFVVDNGKELVVEPMDKEEVEHCLDKIFSLKGIEPLLCAKYCTYTRSPELLELLSSPLFHYEMRLVDDLYQVKEDIIKVSMISHEGESAETCYNNLRPLLDDELGLVISGDTCLDTGLNGVTKGTAVGALQKMWGITPEETVVFGDQYNDVEMFKQAYHSYAMEGASDGVKKFARFQAGSNNKGGVVKAIRQLTGL